MNPASCAAQHFGLWAVEPQWLSRAVQAVRSGLWKPEPQAAAGDDEEDTGPGYELAGDGAAVIRISGMMLKGVSSFGGTSTILTRNAIRAAVRDPKVEGLLLIVDSPGGTAAGTQALADDVFRAALLKPMVAFAEDMMASAAYWVGSQAGFLSANESAEVGSIGVYGIVEDTSGAHERHGIKVHLVSTGPYKGAFADGVPITDAHLAYLRESVQNINELFLRAITRGRGSKINARELSTGAEGGKVWGASKSLKLGLIDTIESADAALERVRRAIYTARAARQTVRRRGRAA